MSFLDAHEMASLTAAVVRAIKSLPPGVRISDPGFSDQLDSLIRYHDYVMLEPVVKPSVLGGVGIADRIRGGPPYEREDYLETGIIDVFPLGTFDPERFLPADWKISDGAPLESEFQGEFQEELTYLESNESEAVGEGDPPRSVDGIDTGDAVYNKKLIMASFGPSMFSGLMRFYMQSYYGANNELEMQFAREVLGTAVTLKASGRIIGFWSHLSGGIVQAGAAEDLDFRYVEISSPLADGSFTIKACPIDLDTNPASPVLLAYQAAIDDDERKKCLAYLFGESVIRMDLFETIGTYEPTPDWLGNDIYGGWKFNNAGTAASCCLTDYREDVGGIRYWESYEVTFSFTGAAGGPLSVSIAVSDVVEWQDPIGFQVWRPTGDYLSCERALRTVPPHRPEVPMTCSEAPIYCWYNEDDELQVVKISHEATTHAMVTHYDWDNIYPTTSPVNDIGKLISGAVIQDEDRSMQQMNSLGTVEINVKVGTTTETFNSETGDLVRYNVGGSADGGLIKQPSPPFNIQSTFQGAISEPFTAPDYHSYLDGSAACGGASIEVYYGYGTQTMISLATKATTWEVCDLYIPQDDVESLYLARVDYVTVIPDGSNSVTKWTLTPGRITNQGVRLSLDGSACYEDMDLHVWADGRPSGLVLDGPADIPTMEGDLTMKLYSRTEHDTEAVYDGSIDTWFFRSLTAGTGNPPAKLYSESHGLSVKKGSDLGSLGYSDWNVGVWTGWL